MHAHPTWEDCLVVLPCRRLCPCPITCLPCPFFPSPSYLQAGRGGGGWRWEVPLTCPFLRPAWGWGCLPYALAPLPCVPAPCAQPLPICPCFRCALPLPFCLPYPTPFSPHTVAAFCIPCLPSLSFSPSSVLNLPVPCCMCLLGHSSCVTFSYRCCAYMICLPFGSLPLVLLPPPHTLPPYYPSFALTLYRSGWWTLFVRFPFVFLLCIPHRYPTWFLPPLVPPCAHSFACPHLPCPFPSPLILYFCVCAPLHPTVPSSAVPTWTCACAPYPCLPSCYALTPRIPPISVDPYPATHHHLPIDCLTLLFLLALPACAVPHALLCTGLFPLPRLP